MPQPWQSAVLSALQAWDGRRVVLSPDVDGLASASILLSARGGSIAGVYTTSHLLRSADVRLEDTLGALWLDQDICDRRVLSMGQHLLDDRKGPVERVHLRSFNPNRFFGQVLEDSFRGVKGKGRDKYPFGTIHFLWDVLGLPIPVPGTLAYAVLAHADGTWTNGVRYTENCRIWIQEMFGERPMAGFLTALTNGEYIRGDATFEAHQELVQALLAAGVAQESSQTQERPGIPARFGPLQGAQSLSFARGNDPGRYLSKLLGAWEVIQGALGTAAPHYLKEVTPHLGKTESVFPNQVLGSGGIARFVEEKDIFSYAMTGNTTLRYTPRFL